MRYVSMAYAMTYDLDECNISGHYGTLSMGPVTIERFFPLTPRVRARTGVSNPLSRRSCFWMFFQDLMAPLSTVMLFWTHGCRKGPAGLTMPSMVRVACAL